MVSVRAAPWVLQMPDIPSNPCPAAVPSARHSRRLDSVSVCTRGVDSVG